MSVDELAEVLRVNDVTGSNAYRSRALIVFKYLLECSKQQVIDQDVIEMCLHEAGAKS